MSLIQPQTRITYPVAGSPDDLFYGTIDIQTSADALSARELPLRRKVSGVAVTARRLKEYVGSSDGDFHYILRKTGNLLDFYGLPNGTDVSYRPEASFNDREISSPPPSTSCPPRRSSALRHLPPGRAPDNRYLRQQRQTSARDGRAACSTCLSTSTGQSA